LPKEVLRDWTVGRYAASESGCTKTPERVYGNVGILNRGLLPSSPGWLGDPECARRTRFPATGGAPAARLAQHVRRHRATCLESAAGRVRLQGPSRGSGLCAPS